MAASACRLQHVSLKVAEVDEELSKHLSITERTAQMDLRRAAKEGKDEQKEFARRSLQTPGGGCLMCQSGNCRGQA